MKISIATNWDKQLLYNLDNINKRNPKIKIQEVFGSQQSGYFGSARTKRILPYVDKEFIRDYIELAHNMNIGFNYILNSSTFGNREITEFGRNKLKELLDWLVEIKADIVTVTIPYLIDIIKNNYSKKLKINVSIINEVSTLKRFDFFQEMGATRITPSFFSNRDFNFLEKISKKNIEIELLANENCLLQCPFRQYHFNVSSISSLDNEIDVHPIYSRYPVVSCTINKLKSIKENISTPWIRPEDTEIYNEYNINWIKLSHRFMPTDWLTNVANAYAFGKYEGNLYDIIDPGSFKINKSYKYSNVFSEYASNDELAMLEDFDIYIDNKKLDGFINFFIKNREHDNCDKCNYCKKIAEKVISFDKPKAELLKNILLRIRENMSN